MSLLARSFYVVIEGVYNVTYKELHIHIVRERLWSNIVDTYEACVRNQVTETWFTSSAVVSSGSLAIPFEDNILFLWATSELGLHFRTGFGRDWKPESPQYNMNFRI
jgi:hypothetical protein